ncbi:MAG: hypothetical protein A2V81_01310 [Candidatus Abawacabacteria bacterium RBG_16_42_10]|uniref:Integral membrane protein n=1 Tax=Candidatus Abawacabacteria bacterium RBG_16_42_10 TaxID=1817814 RepID=A0A1F4XLR6_9BACT|nr:MAG: hypothetical protein A2V81_01310 [Candidatus Abawacabacteria bacterium RBG_16_42_10]
MSKKIPPHNLSHQIDFPMVLFDSLYGLILFFNLDSFLDITDPLHFVLYVFSLIVVIHWWFEYKSADDCYGEEISRSTVNTIIGVILIILLEFFILKMKDGKFYAALSFLMLIFVADIVWALIFRFLGRWKTKDKKLMTYMENELERNMVVDLVALILLAGLFFAFPYIEIFWFVMSLLLIYIFYIYLTYKYKIIDVEIL